MAVPLMSRKKTDVLCASVFAGMLVILAYTGRWWPFIVLGTGIAIVLRQYLRGRLYDTTLTIVIFGGLFLTFLVDIHWNILMPVVLVIGAIYVGYREYANLRIRSGPAQTQDQKNEINEAQHDK